MRSLPFSRRGAGLAPPTEFAATVITMPPPTSGFAPSDGTVASDLPAGADAPPSLPCGPATMPGQVDSLPAPPEALLVEHRPTLWMVGRYAVKGTLGAGGLGQVWEAWDPLLSRTVAVKTLPLDPVEGSGAVAAPRAAMFLREVRAAAGLSHPHIVTVHDAGLAPQGMYLAMERLHGRDLRQALAAGWQPTPWQAAQLVRRVADALAYAHARGVVHCDVKPSNIFLDRRDRPKLLDFGIARLVRRDAATPRAAAGEAVVMGSPQYLAPEQLSSGSADERTDIRGLGLVLYELLSGRRAFDGVSVEAIAAAVLADTPPLPAHHVRPEVPRTLSAIAARAMARDPADRHASAGDLAAELRAWNERHPPPAERRAVPRRPRPLSVAMSAIATARATASRASTRSTALAGGVPGEVTSPLPRRRPTDEFLVASPLPPSLRRHWRERGQRRRRRVTALVLFVALPAALFAAAWFVRGG